MNSCETKRETLLHACDSILMRST